MTVVIPRSGPAKRLHDFPTICDAFHGFTFPPSWVTVIRAFRHPDDDDGETDGRHDKEIQWVGGGPEETDRLSHGAALRSSWRFEPNCDTET